MRAKQFIPEATIGTNPKRPAREGSRPIRGHETEPRYKELDKFNSPEEFAKDANYREYRKGLKASRKQPPASLPEAGMGMWGDKGHNAKSQATKDLERSRNEKKQAAERNRAEERDRAWWKAQDDATKAGKDTFEFDGKTHPVKEQGVAEGIVDTIRSKNYARLADRSADKRATALDNFDEPEHQKQTDIMKQRNLKSRLLNKKGVAEGNPWANVIHTTDIHAEKEQRELKNKQAVADSAKVLKNHAKALEPKEIELIKKYNLFHRGRMPEGSYGRLDDEKAEKLIQNVLRFNEQGVAEGLDDQPKKVFKDKSGKPVGEIGIDPESSPGNGEWYVYHYATGYSVVGFDSAAEAKRELMYVHKHPDAVEGHESTKEQGVAEGLEDSNIQSAIVDTVERLFRKNEISDYGALEAIRQGIKHHFSKPGATTESAIEGILNILDKRMRKSGDYVDLGRFKEALRQGIAHQLNKQGVAEGWKSLAGAAALSGALIWGANQFPDLKVNGQRYQMTSQHALADAPPNAKTVEVDGKTYKIWTIRTTKGSTEGVYAEVKSVKEQGAAEGTGQWIVKYWDKQPENTPAEDKFGSEEQARAFLADLPAHYVKALRQERSVSESKEVDMTGKKCTACKKGTYQETGIHDDMDGVLHCTKCNKQVTRWQAYKEQVVLDQLVAKYLPWVKKEIANGGRADSALNSVEHHLQKKEHLGNYNQVKQVIAAISKQVDGPFHKEPFAEEVSRLSDEEYNRVAAYVRKKYPGTQLSGLGRNPDGSFNVMIDTSSGRHQFKVRFRDPVDEVVMAPPPARPPAVVRSAPVVPSRPAAPIAKNPMDPSNPASPTNILNPLNPASPVWIGKQHSSTDSKDDEKKDKKSVKEEIARLEAELAEATKEFKGPHGTLDIERKPGRTIVKRRDYTDKDIDVYAADKFSNMKLRGQGQGSGGSKNVSSLHHIPKNHHHTKPDYGYDINDKTNYDVDYEPEFEMDEAEGTPEGVPHLTKELLQHIIDQVGTEGAHAICKSIQWGDGAAKELLHLLTKHLKHDVGQIAESIQEFWLSEHGKASRELCKSSKPDADLGASMLASCKSQGLRARDGDKSHKLGKTAKSRVKVGGHRIKGQKYGGPLPSYGSGS